jgi:hypothetical protein
MKPFGKTAAKIDCQIELPRRNPGNPSMGRRRLRFVGSLARLIDTITPGRHLFETCIRI